MKKFIVGLCAALAISGFAQAAEQFKTENDRIGYAIGMNIGGNLKQQQIDVSPDQVAAGLQTAMKGEETLLTVDEMRETLIAFQQRLQQEMLTKAATDAKVFLAENAKKEGVVTLDSGLQYRVVESGSGATPSKDSKVEVHYTGTLIDGTKFDSSYDRGAPASFPVSGVIPGWTEALLLMHEGDKWQLAIPSELAYGERGAPPTIPPNAALLFDVELIKVD